ncbi:hypothetical protein [Dyadobacter sp. CY323]|uniref:hypothetical protein n=1 Tax=Dyadobacter sp. CY323 TaxID=2907302 RepID=UPI001F3D5E9F|nr:hypothetical protein [Dyadobacter sp. CY323]MCE6987459.1 hypothetical protein [Dyadobacter sp. CY323]
MLKQITLACYAQGHANQFINSDTWAVSELYCSMLKSFDTGKVEKVNVNIRDEWGDFLGYYQNHASVVTIRNHFDFGSYSTLNKREKKLMQLEAVHAGMMQVAWKEGWNTDSLLDAYNQCLEKDLKYQFSVGRPKSSPNRIYKIGFWCNWDLDIFELYWILSNKQDTEIKREKFITKHPSVGEFVYYLSWKWTSYTSVILEDKYGTNESWTTEFGDEIA